MDKVNQSRWFAQELIRHVKNLNPRSHSPINILAGIIWILITGAQWSALPKNEFPPKSTCYYWYRKLSENMDFMILFKSVVKNNSNNHVNKNEESYIDAAFVESKSGGDKYGYGWKGKGSNIVLLLNKDSNFCSSTTKKMINLSQFLLFSSFWKRYTSSFHNFLLFN